MYFKISDDRRHYKQDCGVDVIWQKFGFDLTSVFWLRHALKTVKQHHQWTFSSLIIIQTVKRCEMKAVSLMPDVSVFVIVMGLKWRGQKQRNHHGFHHKTWAKWDVSILTLCKYAKSLKQQPIWFAFKFNLKFVFSIQIIK